MLTKYDLEPLTAAEASHWDELITPYDSAALFHRRAWLDYLAASQRVQIRQWAIRAAGRTLGYFCGGVLYKGPFRILGSPLKGWCTNSMGPVVNSEFNQDAFLRALDHMAQEEGIAMLMMENQLLSPESMSEFSYEPRIQPTYVIQLSQADPEKLWSNIDIKCRQKVRKARKTGLVVEEAHDPGIADEFYDQFVEVLGRKGLSPPYGRKCPGVLYRFLKASDQLFALRVRDASGEVVATGLFPHDHKAVYFWGGASRVSAWKYSPNDLLQWTLMETAAGRGLQFYYIGYGPFKAKFGGALQQPIRWQKCYQRTADWARRGYEFYFRTRIRVQGCYQRLVHRQA